MSTRSRVIVQLPNGSYNSVYIHWDGQLSRRMPQLQTYFSGQDAQRFFEPNLIENSGKNIAVYGNAHNDFVNKLNLYKDVQTGEPHHSNYITNHGYISEIFVCECKAYLVCNNNNTDNMFIEGKTLHDIQSLCAYEDIDYVYIFQNNEWRYAKVETIQRFVNQFI